MVPDQMQLRVLLFESAELQVGALQIVGVCVHPVFQHRLQNGRLRRPSCAQVFARLCPGKPRHRADHTRARLLQERKFTAGIEPELVCLLLPVLCAQRLLDAQAAARDL